MIKDKFNSVYRSISLFLVIMHIFVFYLEDAAIVFAEVLEAPQTEIKDIDTHPQDSKQTDLKQPAENPAEVDNDRKSGSAKDRVEAVGNTGFASNNAYSDFNAGALQNLQPSLFTGALTYVMPISVPAGRRGIQPNVALVYSSQSGNGILGMGWSLELGCIERSTKNGVPNYNNSQDIFIFKSGGSTTELVNIGGNEYRAKIEGSFMKFTLNGNSWTAKDKGGTTYYFGQSQGSQQAVSSNIFKWCLDRAEDVLGNYMTLTYIKDANQIYPSRIYYTGYNGEDDLSPCFQVDFDYSDGVREDYFFSYRSNFLIRTDKLLQAITVRQNGYRIREYSLSYSYSPSTKRALLASIVQYGSTDISYFPSIEFTYQQKPCSFSDLARWGNIHNFNNNDWAGIRFSNGAQTCVDIFDINRDGLPDRVLRGYNESQYNQLWVQLNNGSGFDDLKVWPGLANQGSDSKRACIRYGSQHGEVNTVDINGDALPDRIYHNYNNNYNQWEVQLNNGDGFDNGIAWANIDGFHYQPDYTKLWGFAYDPPVWGYIDLFDINGDGKPDRIIRWYQWLDYWNVQLNNGSGFGNTIQWSNVQHQSHISESYIRTGSSNIYFATFDINGDGLPDHLMDNNTGNNTWGAQFNNGRGFENLEEWGPLANLYGSWSYIGYGDPTCVTTVDINGDGLPDRVMRNHDNQFANWQVQINNGHGFEPIAEWGSIIHNNVSDRAHIRAGNQTVYVDFFDINGDGLPDRVMRGNNNYDHWDVQFNNGPIPDLLSGISNGIGGTAAVTYDTYVGHDNTQAADKGKLSFPVNVVVGIQTNDGRGNVYSTQYAYDKAEFNYQEREFRGFGKVTAIDAEGNYSTSYFHQDDYKKGRLYCQETLDSSDRLFAKAENTWSVLENVYPGYPQVKFISLSESNVYTYEGDDSARRIKTNYFYQESPQYGNPTQIIEYGEVNPDNGSDTGEDKRVIFTYYTYNSDNWIMSLPSRVVVKDINGNTVSEKYFYYDGHDNIGEPPQKGLLTKESIWLYNPITAQEEWLSNSYTYDIYGNLTSAIDANSHNIVTTYDSVYHIYPLTITNALGHTVNSAYYGVDGVPLDDGDGLKGMFGQLKYTQDPNGVATYNSYDDLGRLVKIIGPNDNINYPGVIYEYDLNVTNPNSDPVKITQITKAADNPDSLDYPNYYTDYSFYDGLGRIIEVKSPAEPNPATGVLRQIMSGMVEYDNRGLVRKKYLPYFVDASENFTSPGYSQPYFTFQHDCLGRLTKTINPDNTYSSTIFDDWQVASVDENNHQKIYYYDAYQRLIRVDEYNNDEIYTTTYLYDISGNLISVVDSQGNATTVIYDSLGRKIRMQDPDMGVWNYEYDAVGNMVKQIDAAQQELEFTYDALNRLTRKVIQNNQSVNYEYDGSAQNYYIGRLRKITYEAGSAEFFYDNLGREMQSVKQVSDVSYQVSRAYDPLSRLKTITYPDGETVTYIYNPQGIESVVSSIPRTYISNIDYSPTSQITRIQYGNGTSTDYTYSPQTLRLANLATADSSGSSIQDLAYEFDNIGNIVGIVDNVNDSSQAFDYDNLNRLTYANGAYYGQAVYSYDSISNILSKEGLTFNYQDSRPHAVSSMSNGSETVNFTYDANGNLTNRANQQTGEQSNYFYDFESRLTRVEQVYPQGQEVSVTLEFESGWNFFSLPVAPANPEISQVFSTLKIGVDFDQISKYDPQIDAFQHYVGNPDFDEFNTLEYNTGYVIYVKNQNGVKVNITGTTPYLQDILLSEGWNLIPYPYLSQRSIEQALGNLKLDVDFDLVLRYNNSTGEFEQYPGSLSELEPNKSYYIRCLRNTAWDIQPLSRTTEFFYDGDGGRVKRVSEIDQGETAVYIGSLYEKTFFDNPEIPVKIKKHIFAGANRIASVEQQGSDTQAYFYHSDHLGSSNVITGAGGSQVCRYEYKPFGDISFQDGGYTTDIKYTGKIQDDTGLYYYGARYYDPLIGRFISPDTIVQSPQDPQSLNRYAYCRNNPIKYIDPTGHWFFAAIIAAVKAISAYAAVHPIISSAAMGGFLGGVNAGISGYDVFQGIGVGILGGMVGGAVGLGISNFLDGAIGNFWAGTAGAGFGGAAAGAATAGALGGNVGLGSLAGLAGGIAGFIGGYNNAPSVGHVMGNIASAGVSGGDLGDAAWGGFIDASLINTAGLIASDYTIGEQGRAGGGDLIFYKAGFDIPGLFLSYLQGAPISHVAIAKSATEQVDSHIKGNGTRIRPIDYSRKVRMVKWAGSGNKDFIALAVQYGKDNAFQYWLGHKREICSTFVSRTARETGLSVPGFSPASQYYNIEGIPYHNFYKPREQ